MVRYLSCGSWGRRLAPVARARAAHPTRTRQPAARRPAAGGPATTPLLRRTQKQLTEYFAGRRRTFDLPLAPHGTSFQLSVWNELATIPFGATSTYGAIARAVGQPQAARAVGGAIGANPLALVIPCHRVLAGDRRLTGFSGGDGVPTKVALLTLEGCEFRA